MVGNKRQWRRFHLHQLSLKGCDLPIANAKISTFQKQNALMIINAGLRNSDIHLILCFYFKLMQTKCYDQWICLLPKVGKRHYFVF